MVVAISLGEQTAQLTSQIRIGLRNKSGEVIQFMKSKITNLTPSPSQLAVILLASALGIPALAQQDQTSGAAQSAPASTAQQTPATTEPQLLSIIANAVGQSARPAYVKDVLSRKVTIATGNGQIHGKNYVLENWGLEVDYQAAELTGP